MGERKVVNKYYPPDSDPAKIPRRRRPTNSQMKVHDMLPMSVRCSTCGNFIGRGTKFNARKEDIGENYLGLKIFRFYFKCTKCSAEITYKTDPQNNDYAIESGATRNHEPWREKEEDYEKLKREREAKEMGDDMKALENRTFDSKREMDILAALDEMKSMKSRRAHVSVEAMLKALRRSAQEKERKEMDEEEAIIKSLFQGEQERFIKRCRDERVIEDDDDDNDTPAAATNGETSILNFRKKQRTNEISVFTSSVKVSIVKRKNNLQETKSDHVSQKHPTSLKSIGLLSLCQHYESEDN